MIISLVMASTFLQPQQDKQDLHICEGTNTRGFLLVGVLQQSKVFQAESNQDEGFR